MAKANRATRPTRYVILPPIGLVPSDGPDMATLGTALGGGGGALGGAAREGMKGRGRGVGIAGKSSRPASAPPAMKVVDSIDDGAKLVEMSAATMMDLRAAQPGLRIVPEVFYRTLEYRPDVLTRPRKKATPLGAGAGAGAVSTSIAVSVRSKADGSALKGVRVVAFTDYAKKVGFGGTTNARGDVSFDFGSASKTLDRLYAFAPLGYWGAMRADLTIKDGTTIELEPIALVVDDGVRRAYGRAAPEAGAGVKVGVIDSGIDLAHPDLKVDGGTNTVEGEDDRDFGDNGSHHGTHVAGIIAARGALPGVAPGVTLRSYRVFPRLIPGVDNQASSFAIIKAIAGAVADGCDLINMSLGGADPDDATRSAIAYARAAGTLVLVAAGNDGRQAVAFPANDPRTVAVSALGRRGTFPAGSEAEGDVLAPFGKGKAKDDFVAAFSNIGPEIDVIGPGVGVVSTVPGGYAIMSGTSMACPTIAGEAARLLAANPAALAMPRDQARSDEFARLLFRAATPLGFGAEFEGHGLPS